MSDGAPAAPKAKKPKRKAKPKAKRRAVKKVAKNKRPPVNWSKDREVRLDIRMSKTQKRKLEKTAAKRKRTITSLLLEMFDRMK